MAQTRSRSNFSGFLLWCLWCLVIPPAVESFNWWFPSEENTKIVPSYVTVFFGERVKIMCTTEDYNASEVNFNVTAGDHIWMVPKENMTVVNATTAYAWVEITESTHIVRTTYECVVGSTSLRSTMLYAEYPIQKVTNFTGIYYADRSDVTIRWKLGVHYLAPETINVSTVWNPSGSVNMRGSNCSFLAKETCIFKHFGSWIYFVQVTVKTTYPRPSPEYIENALPDSVASEYKFVLPENVKINSIEGFEILSGNSTCFNLTWNDPSTHFGDIRDTEYNFTYWFRIQLKRENDAQFELRPQFIPEKKPFVLCSLEPHTEYKLRLQVKTQDSRPELWSDPAEKQAMTDEDRPLRGPPLTATSYFSDQCLDEKRKVLIYWNNPKESTVRGELNKYIVTYGETRELLRPGYNFYAKDLDCSASYNISVFAGTEVGLSIKPSHIYIPSDEDILQVPETFEFKVEEHFNNDIISETADTKNVTVSWNSSHFQEQDVTLIFYMCQKGYIESTSTCYNDFETREVNVKKNEVAVSNVPVTENLFGYALMSANGSQRGIEWTDCVFQSTRIPDRPKDVRVAFGSQSNSLVVSWYAPRCERKTQVLILEYKLFVCEGQPTLFSEAHLQSDCNVHTIDSLHGTVYRLENLKMDQQYRIFVQSVSPSGAGHLSDPADAVTLSDSDSISNTTLAIVITGVITLLIVMGLFTTCYIRQCKKRKTYYKNLIEESEHLEEPSGHKSPSFTSKTSHESGIGTADSNSSDPSVPQNLATAPPVPISSRPLYPKSFGPGEPTSREKLVPDFAENTDVKIPVPDAENAKEKIPESDAENTKIKIPLETESDSSLYSSSENSNSMSNPYSKFRLDAANGKSSDGKSSLQTGSASCPSESSCLTDIVTGESSSRPLVGLQISVDEGFMSPSNGPPQINFGCNVNNNESLILKVSDDPDSHRRGVQAAFLSLQTGCENGNQNKASFTSHQPSANSKVGQNCDEYPLTSCTEKSEIHDLRQKNIDPSSAPSSQPVGGYVKLGYSSDRDQLQPKGTNAPIINDGYKSQTFMTESEILQFNENGNDTISTSPAGAHFHYSKPERFITGKQEVESDGYKSHDLMANVKNAVTSTIKKPESPGLPPDDLSDLKNITVSKKTFSSGVFQLQADQEEMSSSGFDNGYMSQSFIRDQNIHSDDDGYKPQNFITDDHQVQPDAYKPQNIITEDQQIQCDGYKPQSFIEHHQDIQSDDGHTLQSFIRDQNIHSDDDGYKPQNFITDDHQVQPDAYKPQNIITEDQQAQCDGYKPQNLIGHHQDTQSDGYQTQFFSAAYQDIQDGGYKPPIFLRDSHEVQSDGCKSLDFMTNGENVPTAEDGYKKSEDTGFRSDDMPDNQSIANSKETISSLQSNPQPEESLSDGFPMSDGDAQNEKSLSSSNEFDGATCEMGHETAKGSGYVSK